MQRQSGKDAQDSTVPEGQKGYAVLGYSEQCYKCYLFELRLSINKYNNELVVRLCSIVLCIHHNSTCPFSGISQEKMKGI